MRLGRCLAGRCLGLAAALAACAPFAARADDTIKIGFPMPLSGPAAVYGVPVTKGAELAVQEINAKGGVLGRKIELLPRDSKANADEAVRLARELIIKDDADFLAGTLTSAEAPAVSTIAKENKIVFVAPVAKTVKLTAPNNLHPYIFRVASNTEIEGHAAAMLVAKWADVKTLGTIAPDYAYGRDAVAAFSAHLAKLRPDIQIIDQQWPKLGEPDFTAFISAQMGKKPDAVFCDVFGGDFISLAKQAGPLGYFKAINYHLIDGGEVGTPDAAVALGPDYPFGITSDAYDPVIWQGDEPPAHKEFIDHLKAYMKSDTGSGWAVQGYTAILALAEGIKKAGSTDSDKVAAAMLGMSFDTPVGRRTFNPATHETEAGEFWGEMIKDPTRGFAVMKNPEYLNPTTATN